MKKSQNFSLSEVMAIVIVVSFLMSAATGFIAGGLGYNWFDKSRNAAGDEPQFVAASDQEQAVISVVEKAAPAVVSIVVTKDVPVIERYYREYSPFENEQFFKEFFGDDFFGGFNLQVPEYRQNGFETQQIGGGTGFIISSDGLIITNKHVVADEGADYTVLTNEGENIPAQVLARDPVQDLAVLKIDKTGLATIELGDSEKNQIGQTVVAIGNALGEYRNTVSVGVISGLQRSIMAGISGGQAENLTNVIQTDAAINPGNSGGPLLNLSGQAIGINVAIAQGAEGIGFALSINDVKRSVNQVKERGKITYPFLGVRYVTLNNDISQENGLSVDYGAWLVRGSKGEPAVVEGSPAADAGLQESDIILELNNKRVDEDNLLSEMINMHSPGDRVSLKVLRSDEEIYIDVILTER